MKWIATISKPSPLSFIIQPEKFRDASSGEEFIWYYLFVYEGNNDKCTYDYLQDTLDQAKGFALEKFNVPLDAWKQVDS